MRTRTAARGVRAGQAARRTPHRRRDADPRLPHRRELGRDDAPAGAGKAQY